MAEKKDPVRGPFEWLWHISLLVFGSVVLLCLSWSFIQPALPYILAAMIVAGIAWIIIFILKFRRDRW